MKEKESFHDNRGFLNLHVLHVMCKRGKDIQSNKVFRYKHTHTSVISLPSLLAWADSWAVDCSSAPPYHLSVSLPSCELCTWLLHLALPSSLISSQWNSSLSVSSGISQASPWSIISPNHSSVNLAKVLRQDSLSNRMTDDLFSTFPFRYYWDLNWATICLHVARQMKWSNILLHLPPPPLW